MICEKNAGREYFLLNKLIRRMQMREDKYQPQIPDIMEAIFDAAYLIFDLVAAILFFILQKEICYLFFMEY